MKKFAEIADNIVINISNFKDDEIAQPPWIDVTGLVCDIGWPLDGGVPLEKPSRWHTVTSDSSGWEISSENQALKDQYETEQQRASDIVTEQESTGLKGITVDQAKGIVQNRINNIRSLPDSNLAEIQAKLSEICDQMQWLFEKVVVFLLR